MVFQNLHPKIQKLIQKKDWARPTKPQEKAFGPIFEGKDVLLTAPTGIGKCVSGDTLILTESGFQEVKDLYKESVEVNSVSENLEISTSGGRVIKKDKNLLYKVETRTGKEVKVTSDHKFLTINSNGTEWKELKDLEEGDFVATPRKLQLPKGESEITADLFSDFSRTAVKTSPSTSKLIGKIKEREGIGLRKLSSQLDISKTTLQQAKKNKPIGVSTLNKISEKAGISLSSLLVEEIRGPGRNSLNVPPLDGDFAYFVGILQGDGNINQGCDVRFSTNSENLLDFFENYSRKFGLHMRRDKSRKYDYYVMSKSLVELLEAIGFKKQKDRIPHIFLKDKNLLASYIQGIYDTDGSIYKGQIEIVTKSERFSQELIQALLVFGIPTIRKEKEVSGKTYYRVFIFGCSPRKKFSKKIGFRTEEKTERLTSSLDENSNPNLDLIPEVGELLERAIDDLEVSYSRERLFGLYESYKEGRRSPSRKSLTEVLDWFEKKGKDGKNSEEMRLLRKFAKSDIFWDEIINIRKEGKEEVYDATVPQTNNFIGNCIVLHNTEAAALPLLNKILEEESEPIALLYITPLRALNRDMFDRLLWWCRKLDIEVTIRHGDTSDYERRKQAQFPEQIFVTTPETLQAILPGSKMKEHLKNVKYVVVDEIHELVESKRGTQLSIGLERLKKLCGRPQMIGLSATVGSPEEVARFLSDDAEVVSAEETKDLDIVVESPSPNEKDIELSSSLFADPGATSRIRRIHGLIEGSESTLVFTNTRESSEVLSSRLRRLDKEYDHSIHHSSLAKDVRIQNEEKFKEGDLKSLICTSSLELGIDIGKIDQVLQYGSPRRVSKLLQRVGRSGHKVEGLSKGRIIALDPDDIFESAVIARKALDKELEPTVLHKEALDVMANQIIGYCLDEYGLDWKEIYSLIRGSYFYRDVSRQEFYRVLKFLERLRYVWIDDKIKRAKKSWKYYYENLSTIPDIYNYQVVDSVEGKDVGQLDESFVAEYGKTGTTFIMKGRSWRVISVDEGKVFVEPVNEMDSAIPAWEGELIPVPKSVAQEVGELRSRIKGWLDEVGFEGAVENLMEEYPVNNQAAKKMVKYIKGSDDEISSGNEILVEKKGDFTVMHSCNGTLVNQTLSKLLASLLIREKGRSIAVKNDPYRIMIQGAEPELVINMLEKTSPDDLEFIVNDAIEKSQLFKWRFIHVAKRFGVVQERAKWDKVNISRIVDSYRDSPIFDETKREIFHEKLDMEGAKEVLRRIQSGGTQIRKCETGSIGKQGLTHKFKELMGPEKPKKEIFKAFKSRILNTKLRLMCVRCGEYRVTKRVRDLEDDIKCPVCGSGRITVVKPYEEEKEEILDKTTDGKDLSQGEEKKLDKMERVADLVLTYGRKFIVALGGRGVGPETAIKILAKQKTEDEDFYNEILEMEKEYTRTKKYWSG